MMGLSFTMILGCATIPSFSMGTRKGSYNIESSFMNRSRI
jgi:hypothetical protein